MTPRSRTGTRRPFSSSVHVALAGLALTFAACTKPASESGAGDAAATEAGAAGAPVLETVDQRASYGIGYNVGSGMARQAGFEVDREALVAGLQDGLSGAKLRLTEAELRAAFGAVQEQAAAKNAAAAEANLAGAKAFLEKNRTRPGVTVTASGLQYEVLKSGSGPKPGPTDTVEVHYHGTLPDGTVFDSSVERGQPTELAVNGVIKGWVEALQMMSVGDKWKLYIPPDLAYGPRASGKIPANSALVFEVELLGIK